MNHFGVVCGLAFGIATALIGCETFTNCEASRECSEENDEEGVGGASGPDSGGMAALGGGGSGSGGDSGGNLEKPTILGATIDGSALGDEPVVGVGEDARIVIRFSQAMDPGTTEAAFVVESSELAALEWVFAWNATFTVLSVSATEPLPYPSVDGPDEAAPIVLVRLETSAKDVAGRALAEEFLAEFSMLRRVTETLVPTAVNSASAITYSGDSAHGAMNPSTSGCPHSSLLSSIGLPQDAYFPGIPRGSTLSSYARASLHSLPLGELAGRALEEATLNVVVSLGLSSGWTTWPTSPNVLRVDRLVSETLDRYSAMAGNVLQGIDGGEITAFGKYEFDVTETVNEALEDGDEWFMTRSGFGDVASAVTGSLCVSQSLTVRYLTP